MKKLRNLENIMESKLFKKYSKVLLGVLLVLTMSVALPILFLKNFATLNLNTFGIMSLFSSLFGIPFIIIADMFYTKIYKGRIVDVIGESNVIGKVIDKKIIKDKFSAPLFLAPINITLFMAATALEKDDEYYQLSVIINQSHKTLMVNKNEYDKIKISELIHIRKIDKQETIIFSWAEMLLLGIFYNQEIENFSQLKLAKS